MVAQLLAIVRQKAALPFPLNAPSVNFSSIINVL